MRLSLLIGPEMRCHPPLAMLDPDIHGISADSRNVGQGYLFAALTGARADGRLFIPDALARGAAAVLGASDLPTFPNDPPVARIEAVNPRRALAQVAARFHGRQPRTIAAVTGTNGKTSVAVFTRQIWTALGHKAASLGTLGLSAPGFDRPGALTTPDPVALHATLAELAAAGIDHAAMEASSHGLDQFRLHGVRVTAAAFTNLSRDHLDYHLTMAAYLAAKRRLFEEVLDPLGTAVLNADAPEYALLHETVARRGLREIDFGRKARDLRLLAVRPHARGQHLQLELFGRPTEIDLPLAGEFQAANALAALGLVLAGDAPLEPALAALAALSPVPGRMQQVALRTNGAAAYIDYAHTPAALETVLTALRPHTARHLVAVIGAGGDRDPGKRVAMGAVAARLADRVIVTDDNPRTEDPAAIRRQVLLGCPGATEIGARAGAIAAAVEALEPGDVLVVCGKGHERGQIVGDTVLPFDDADAVRAAVATADGSKP